MSSELVELPTRAIMLSGDHRVLPATMQKPSLLKPSEGPVESPMPNEKTCFPLVLDFFGHLKTVKLIYTPPTEVHGGFKD